MTDVAITEFTEIDPDELHLVGKGANGFKALLAKSASEEVREVLETIADVTDTEIVKVEDRAKCDACEGVAKGTEPCKKCFGTGLLPNLGETPTELIAAAKAIAASGAPVLVRDDCPTCGGGGRIADGSDDGKDCPDCDGSGKDSTEPPSDKLARVDGDLARIHEGDAKGREAVDKAIDDTFCDDTECDVCKEEFGGDLVEKAKLKAKTRNALPDSAFALPGRKYPIHDENHARNALARVAQNGTPEEQAKVKAAVKRKFPNIEVDGAEKGQLDGSVFSSPNPALSDPVAQGSDPAAGPDDSNDDASAPGSPAWEAVDAQIATDAATALMAAAECIRQFANRENQEVAAGEGNDVFDVYDASSALCAVNDALGVMARLAFHEGLEAAKSVTEEEEEIAEKSGKRLSIKSVTALAAARDHITQLLGEDDPAKTNENDDEATKSIEIDMDKLSKEIENMETDELTKVLDARDEKLVGIVATAMADAMKGKSAMETADGIAGGKKANSKAKAKNPKGEMKDLEDEADQGSNDSASSPAKGAAKSEGDEVSDEVVEDAPADDTEATKAEDEVEVELTPEEIEAKKARKDAKKALRAAKDAEKEAAEHAAMTKAIEEATSEVRKANDALQERLAQVEKMAAPSDIVRTRPTEDLNKAAEKDVMDLRIAELDRLALETADADIRKASREQAKELRAARAAL